MRIFITGGASGLGASLSQRLLEAGHTVALCYHSAQDHAQELQKRFPDLSIFKKDFQDSNSSLEDFVEEVHQKLGGMDILVNNAAIYPQSHWDTLKWNELYEVIHINTWIPFELSRLFAQKAASEKTTQASKLIVQILDARLDDYDQYHLGYQLSKRLLHDLTRVLSYQLAPRIRVNAIAPGALVDGEKPYPASWKNNPLGRVGSNSDIWQALSYLIESPFVTGEVLYVDGGRHLRSFFSS